MREYYSNLRQLHGEGETPRAEQFLGGWTRSRSGVPGAVRVRRRLHLPTVASDSAVHNPTMHSAAQPTVCPHPARVLIRPFLPATEQHCLQICARVLNLSDADVHAQLEQVLEVFIDRQLAVREFLQRRFEQVRHYLRPNSPLSPERAALLGACFTHECALEAAALFNPSIVPHPDQSGLTPDTLRFVLSLRAIGDGHISSITFRTGTVDAQGNITINPPAGHGLEPEMCAIPEVRFAPNSRLSERVLFPMTPAQGSVIDHPRFVRFVEDDGQIIYYATCTACNGTRGQPHFIVTRDFLEFRLVPFEGPVPGSGLALFPRKIHGRYAMLGCPDGENLHVMFSDQLRSWADPQLLLAPAHPWEFIQLSHGGAPIETEAGWLVISQGIGPMRRCCIGAFLLDRDDPTKVLGRLPGPLLTPEVNAHEGGVPGGIYSCGSLLHAGRLIIPYALSDRATTFATVPVEQVLASMAMA